MASSMLRVRDKSRGLGMMTLGRFTMPQYPLEDIEPGLEGNAFYDPSKLPIRSGAICLRVEL